MAGVAALTTAQWVELGLTAAAAGMSAYSSYQSGRQQRELTKRKQSKMKTMLDKKHWKLLSMKIQCVKKAEQN